MIVALLGVLVDGSDYAPAVPRNPARELRLALGQDVLVRLSVVTPSGQQVDLSAGSLVLSARRRAAWPAMFSAPRPGHRDHDRDREGCCGCGRPGCHGCSQPRYGSDARTARITAPDLLVNGVLNAPAGRNRADFTIAGSATKPLEPGRYAYDVWLTLAGLRDQVIPTSPLVLEPAVTFPP